MKLRTCLVQLARAAAVSVLVACGGGDAGLASVHTDSAGIEIVRYDGADRPPPFTLREEFRLGGSETIAEQSFFQVYPGTVDADAAGNLYVLDRAGSRVVVFDGAGTFVRSMGRAGSGPGELGFPGGVDVEPDGTVNVVDFGKRGMVRFDPSGEPLPELSPLPPGYYGGVVRTFGDARVLPMRRSLAEGGVDALVVARAADTTVIGSIALGERKAIQLPSCGMGFSGMSPLFTPSLRWAAAGNRIALSTTAHYDVEIFEDGREVRRVRRAIAPTPATEALALEEVGESMQVQTEGGVRRCDAREVVEQQGFAETVPATSTLALSPDGWLWVLRGGPRDSARPIDLFDANGDYVGTFPPDSPFPILFLPDGRIAAGETDDVDVTRLVVYTVERQVLGEGTR
jgi:6-bladed beta-propeller